MSLTPFFTSNFWPAAPSWNSLEREFDRDMARMNRLITDSTQHFLPDEHGVIHRQPNYSYDENERQAYLEVELPGVPKNNVNIDLEGKSLVITAKRYKAGTTVHIDISPADEHHEEKTTEKDTEIEHKEEPKERKPSVVYRLKLRIGHRFDADNIQANMEGDGLLKMIIPFKSKDTPRPIQIQSANM